MDVSVIIPAYNAERWLPETLQSVEAQELPRIEVIIVDDGSTDGTAELVRERWPEFRMVSIPNGGVSNARNVGFSLAQGKWVQFLDADDLLLPGKLVRQLSMMKSHEADVVYGNWQKLNATEGGDFIHGEVIERRWEDVDVDAEIAFFTDFWCPTAAYLYRRDFLSKVGPWKDWLPVIQDARFAFDCASAGGRWLHDATVGVLYRQHSTGSVSTRSRQAFFKDCLVNAEDIEKRWCGASAVLSPQRTSALIKVYAGLARGSYGVDESLFEECYRHIRALNPNYIPQSPPQLKWLAHLVGYRRAEAIAHWIRQRRGR